MWPNPLFPANLVTFIEKILNKNFNFCAGDDFFKICDSLCVCVCVCVREFSSGNENWFIWYIDHVNWSRSLDSRRLLYKLVLFEKGPK